MRLFVEGVAYIEVGGRLGLLAVLCGGVGDRRSQSGPRSSFRSLFPFAAASCVLPSPCVSLPFMMAEIDDTFSVPVILTQAEVQTLAGLEGAEWAAAWGKLVDARLCEAQGFWSQVQPLLAIGDGPTMEEVRELAATVANGDQLQAHRLMDVIRAVTRGNPPAVFWGTNGTTEFLRSDIRVRDGTSQVLFVTPRLSDVVAAPASPGSGRGVGQVIPKASPGPGGDGSVRPKVAGVKIGAASELTGTEAQSGGKKGGRGRGNGPNGGGGTADGSCSDGSRKKGSRGHEESPDDGDKAGSSTPDQWTQYRK